MTPRQLLSHKLRDGKYRARKIRAPVDPALTIHAAVLAGFLDKDECYYCGGLLDDYELDHMTSLERGGAHELSNICKACPRCNKVKGTRTVNEFNGLLEKSQAAGQGRASAA